MFFHAISLGAVLMAPPTQAVESGQATAPPVSVALTRTYKADEASKYILKVDMEMGDEPMKMEVEIATKVLKVLEKGMAQVEMKAKPGAGPMEMNVPDYSAKYDPHFMPDTVSVQGEEWPYVLLSIAGFVPAKTVMVGNDFPVSWSAGDGSFKLEGTGKVKEFTEVNGEKAAVIVASITGTPKGDNPGVIKMTSYVSTVNGRLLKSEGRVSIEENAIKFSITAEKKS